MVDVCATGRVYAIECGKLLLGKLATQLLGRVDEWFSCKYGILSPTMDLCACKLCVIRVDNVQAAVDHGNIALSFGVFLFLSGINDVGHIVNALNGELDISRLC